jgi:hypothetical protein
MIEPRCRVGPGRDYFDGTVLRFLDPIELPEDQGHVHRADAASSHRETAGGGGLLYEIKVDRYRAPAIKSAGEVKLRSRNDNDFSGR